MAFRNHDADAVLVSRVDSRSPLSSHSPHGIRLDAVDWLSVEHYYQAMKFEDFAIREAIRSAPHPDLAT